MLKPPSPPAPDTRASKQIEFVGCQLVDIDIGVDGGGAVAHKQQQERAEQAAAREWRRHHRARGLFVRVCVCLRAFGVSER